MIAIVNYQMGNVGAILNMLKKIGAPAKITASALDIESADKIILPGVGSFDNGIYNIEQLKLRHVLKEKVLDEKVPVLGICLGAQLMTEVSEEGELAGLGWVNADTVKFKFIDDQNAFKIPHMGWNTVNIKKSNYIYHEMYEDAKFYFVHSYHFKCHNEEDILTTTQYGYNFTSSFQKENIIGVQFHPEKSHKYGFKLLSKFAGVTKND